MEHSADVGVGVVVRISSTLFLFWIFGAKADYQGLFVELKYYFFTHIYVHGEDTKQVFQMLPQQCGCSKFGRFNSY